MDRQTIIEQADSHKINSVNARNEGRLWDALFEECMYFHFDRQARGTPKNELPIQAMLTFGVILLLMRFPPQLKKEATAKVIEWSIESGDEEKLREILATYKK